MIKNLYSRRSFLKGTALATGGLLLSLELPDAGRHARSACGHQGRSFPMLSSRIDEQGVTLIMPPYGSRPGHLHFQRMMMAEELELDLDKVESGRKRRRGHVGIHGPQPI